MNMNILEELQSLDLNERYRPLAVPVFRAAAVGMCLAAIVATVAGLYMFVYQEKMPVLEKCRSRRNRTSRHL